MKTNASLLCHRLKPVSGIRNALKRIGQSTRFDGFSLSGLDFNRGRPALKHRAAPTTPVKTGSFKPTSTGAVDAVRNLIPWRLVLGMMTLLAITLPACVPQPTPQTAVPSATLPSTLAPSATPQADPATSQPDTSQPDPPTPLPLLTSSPLPLSPSAAPATEAPDIPQPDPSRFPLALPVPISGTVPIDPSYRFASTQSGNREPHHGVEFLLPFGSPVLAAADGTVLFAGDDNNGGPYSPPKNYAFYGNFVILEHPIRNPQSAIYNFYTLYAHLSQINVQTGDPVHAGDEIGLIGFTGAALGPHLHFEVRLNGTTYADSYNPELFLDQPERGVLIGRILDANGHPIPPTALTLTPLDPAGRPLFLTTYEDVTLALRPPFNENFALALPPGQYELAFVLYGIQKQILDILPGEITFFDITVGNE